MRLTSYERTVAIALTFVLAAGRVDAQVQAKQVTLPTRAGQTNLPKDPLVKNVAVGAAAEASGLPLADLLVKDSYLDNLGGFEGVNFLISNAGQQDAGPFDVYIGFLYPAPGSGEKSSVYKVDGLKIGESKWVSAAPMCCGWTPTEAVVNNTDHYEVVIDPSYTKADPADPYNPSRSIEVKPRIRESNKANNRFLIDKADMRKGKFSVPNQKSNAAPLGTVKVQPPVIKH